MGNVRKSIKFEKKSLNVNFDEIGLTILLNSETLVKMRQLAIGALNNLTLQVMSAILAKANIKGNVGVNSQIRESVQISKELGGKIS